MIVREILDEPNQPFDFYNDYKDTKNWLLGLIERDPANDRAKTAIELLDSGYEKYLAYLSTK